MSDLLLTPIVFLLTAVLLVPLAQRLGLGSVLGYLIGGCIIGPWGLGLIVNVERISHVAEIGVVLMLFLIGLELQPAKLMEMRRTVLGGGALQMTACGAALSGAAWMLGMEPTAALVAGLTLALSSTAIAVQHMSEQHIANTPAGKSAFGILLFQDMAAIPLLVLVPLLGPRIEGAPGFNWLFAAAALATVFVIGRYALRPALRLMARTGLREIFTGFALLLVLGIAQLMTLASLSMGLGAFLAGVLLAGSEYRKALEADLEPFKGLLLGLFFTSVGMSMNLGLLASAPLRIALLTLAYLALKLALLVLLARAMPVPTVQRWTFAGLLAQGSEFAFVVFAVARTAGVMTPSWEELLVLVVAVSMALTPVAVLGAQALSARLHRTPPRAPDEIEPDDARVIIAGFGRVGQIAGRLLTAAGIKVTVLDNDPDMIATLRRFGFRVFYGDATRLDLLQAAGAAEALVLINAIDDMETNLALTDLARQHFPQLAIIGRARNLSHLFELRARGVQHIERETFESALLLGRAALVRMGIDAPTAQRMAARFREHNLATVDAIFPHYQDEAAMISIAQAARNELEQSIQQDRTRLGGDAQ
ncbi:MAG TPA: glutathione-regulated potassium-efflux system protein KefC [Telluria sp.]|nr:glutathione-regulated potassium-efflux system protein KefC [Telluria sp.]